MGMRCCLWRLAVITVLLGIPIALGKKSYKVQCSSEILIVEVVKSDDIESIYLEQLKSYPDPACHPTIDENKATFQLSLQDISRCGTTKIVNKITGHTVFYHRIVIDYKDSQPKDVLLVKCDQGIPDLHALHKRDVLPAGFTEPEDLEYTKKYEGKAPEPALSIGVRQNGRLIGSELNVQPGAPLKMEIYLDSLSAPIYGILASQMEVTDTGAQNEPIVLNGCSVDPYLFDNFNTTDGDYLSANFRAFKFPDSNYVLFKGTVNVCLDKCQGILCGNGQIGYGRRRRAIPQQNTHDNKIYEITTSVRIKVEYKDGELYERGILKGRTGNKTEDNSNRDNGLLHNQVFEGRQVQEEVQFTVLEETNTASASHTTFYIILGCLTFILRL